MKWDLTLEYRKGKLIGIDEVGRGCLAGPVVSCAVIMPSNSFIQGVRDSKRLRPKKREQLAKWIRMAAIGIGYGMAEPAEIDAMGIRPAVQLTMRRAVEDLFARQTFRAHIACDYETVPLPMPQTSVIRGDDTVYSIACASILAKVYRDSMAQDWENKYPGYDLLANKGYGTARHRAGIEQLGLTPLHRRSFCKAWSKK